MKKIIVLISLIFVILGGFTANIYADDPPYNDYTEGGAKGAFTIVFDKDGKKLDGSSYESRKDELNKYLQGMQPGDKATVDFILRNDYNEEVVWWMKNDTIKTFENDTDYGRGSVSGGNYTYTLSYDGKNLYTSGTVGGEETEAHHEEGLDVATYSLDEFFELGGIKPGETKKVTLYFALDGETQKNNYQDVLGTLQVSFAVEIPETNSDKIKRVEGEPTYVYVPYTGDSSDLALNLIIELILLNLLLYIIWNYIAFRRRQEARR